MSPREILEASLRGAGLPHFGFLSEGRLRAALGGLSPELRSRYGTEAAKGAVAVALPYGEGPAEVPEWARAYPGPIASLGRFARANWYAELGARLDLAAAGARAALAEAGLDPGPSGEWRRLVNSGLPEKRLALEAGLGRIGRHTLLMVPGHGSAVVVGLLIAPLILPDSAPPRPSAFSPSCESCDRCVAACPTGALRGDGSLDRELCLQHWSSREGELPGVVEAAWAGQLYGCDLCQEACPHFRPDSSAITERGRLGPGLPAAWVDSASEADIRSALRGSALDRRWISVQALKRNARNLTMPGALPTIKETGGPDGKREREPIPHLHLGQ
jgi:epoxyqueuosine reductase QueG